MYVIRPEIDWSVDVKGGGFMPQLSWKMVRTVRFRLCMSMEWMNECVDWLFITQLLKAAYLQCACVDLHCLQH
jgi:hypothetical protein